MDASTAFEQGARITMSSIWCFFPDQRLEALLELEGRIRRKVAQAAASVGVEHEVIPGVATSDRVFSETVEEIERLKKDIQRFWRLPAKGPGHNPAKRTAKSCVREWKGTAS